jgi:hypothetical protein
VSDSEYGLHRALCTLYNTTIHFSVEMFPLKSKIIALEGQVTIRSRTITYNFTLEQVNTLTYFGLRGCVQKFPDWPPGARTANGTALYHWMQLYRYFVCQYSEFCRHNPIINFYEFR